MSCINKNDKAFRYLAYKFGQDAAENIVRSYTISKNSEEFVFPTVRQALKFIQDNKDSQVENVKSNIKQGDNTTENILRNLKGILTVHDGTVYITKGWLDEAGTALREEQKRIVFDENYRRVQELAKEFPTIFEIKDTRFPYTKVINLNGEEKVEVPDLIDLVPVETIDEKIENEFFEKQKEEEDYLAKQEDIEEVESDLGERSKKNSTTVKPGVQELFDSNPELANNLENKLKEFLKSINVDTIVVNNLQKRLQEKGLNSDAVAVSDILHKAVFLDSNKYNTLDYAEEVATFVIEFMGASNHPEASPLIKTALLNITTWEKYQKYYDLYKDDNIYKNNEKKLKIEILSKLLAEKIVENKDKTKKTKQNKKLTTLENIINNILALFDKIWKSDYYKAVDRFLKQRGIETKGVNKINIRPFDAVINEIVDDILFNNTSKIINNSSRARKGETVVSLKEVLENNSTVKEIYHKLNSLGFMFTGSPALSQQGTVYRESNKNLHDLDWQVPKELENTWLDLVKSAFPDLTYKINPKTNQAQVFSKNDKTTHSLMIKGMPVDFFININPPSIKNKFGNMRWQDTFEAKMDMGRHKDIRDLIDFKTSFNDYFSNINYVYYSLAKIKPGVAELFESNQDLANAVYKALGFKTSIGNVISSNYLFKQIISNAENPDLKKIAELLNKSNIKDRQVLLKDYDSLSPTHGQAIGFIEDRKIATNVAVTDFEYLSNLTTNEFDKEFFKNQSFQETLLHEELHRYTSYLLQVYNHYFEQTKNENEAIKELKNYFENVLDNPNLKKEIEFIKEYNILYKIYQENGGTFNNREFITYGLTNPEEINKLKNIKIGKENLLDRMIKALFNLFSTPTLHDALYDTFSNYYLNFDSNKYKSITDTVKLKLTPLSKNSFSITPQQKQQAQQLYSSYLDTIFPDSKVKDIVYHDVGNTKSKDDPYRKDYIGKNDGGVIGDGFYFYTDPSKKYDENRTVREEVILNINNLSSVKELIDKTSFKDEWGLGIYEKALSELSGIKHDNKVQGKHGKYIGNYSIQLAKIGIDGLMGKRGNNTEIVVFEPEQIHILGSKQDIEGFKEFVSKENTSNEELTDDIKEFLSTFEDNFPWFSNLTLPERIEFFKSIDKDEIDVNCKL